MDIGSRQAARCRRAEVPLDADRPAADARPPCSAWMPPCAGTRREGRIREGPAGRHLHRFPDLAAGRSGTCGDVARAPRSDEVCATAPAADERLPAGGVARGGGEERSPCHGTGGRVLGMVARLTGRSEGGRRPAGRSSTPLPSVLFTRHGLLARHAASKASLPIRFLACVNCAAEKDACLAIVGSSRLAPRHFFIWTNSYRTSQSAYRRVG